MVDCERDRRGVHDQQYHRDGVTAQCECLGGRHVTRGELQHDEVAPFEGDEYEHRTEECAAKGSPLATQCVHPQAE